MFDSFLFLSGQRLPSLSLGFPVARTPKDSEVAGCDLPFWKSIFRYKCFLVHMFGSFKMNFDWNLLQNKLGQNNTLSY